MAEAPLDRMAGQWVRGDVPNVGDVMMYDDSIPAWRPVSGFFYNVKQFGAVGDGSTDDTTAITEAIAAASSAGGRPVYFPNGTYICTAFNCPTKVTLQGDGPWASIIKLKNGANSDLCTLTGD